MRSNGYWGFVAAGRLTHSHMPYGASLYSEWLLTYSFHQTRPRGFASTILLERLYPLCPGTPEPRPCLVGVGLPSVRAPGQDLYCYLYAPPVHKSCQSHPPAKLQLRFIFAPGAPPRANYCVQKYTSARGAKRCCPQKKKKA